MASLPEVQHGTMGQAVKYARYYVARERSSQHSSRSGTGIITKRWSHWDVRRQDGSYSAVEHNSFTPLQWGLFRWG